MRELSLQFHKVMKSKSLKEMFGNIPQSFIQYIAFIPPFLFVLSPLLQFLLNLVGAYYYGTIVEDINRISTILGAFVLVLYIGKLLNENTSFKFYVKEYSTYLIFAVLIVLMIAATCVNGFTDAAINGDSYRNESLFSFVIYFAVYFFCSSIITKSRMKSVIMYTSISISMIIGIAALIHRFGEPILQFQPHVGNAAIFEQFNHYGYYLLLNILLSSSLFISEKKTLFRIFCMAGFILNNIVLIINDTFGCYLACFIALVFTVILLWIKERRINKMSVIMIGVFFAISLVMSFWVETIFTNITTFFFDLAKVADDSDKANSAGTGRWILWKQTCEYISEKPFFGHGIEGIAQRLDADTNGVNTRPHNEFLQYAVFFGIPSAVMYVCGAFSVFLRGLKYKANLDGYTIAAIVFAFGYLVSSFFGNTMYYTAPFLFIFLGLGYGIKQGTE